MMTEHELQNLISLHISENKLGTMFRANVGSGWTGTVHKSSARSVTIYGARRFSTGLPAGFPDLFGFCTITITPNMVGKEIAVFCGIEIKKPDGMVRPVQRNMLDYLQERGARAGIARSCEDAEQILSGKQL